MAKVLSYRVCRMRGEDQWWVLVPAFTLRLDCISKRNFGLTLYTPIAVVVSTPAYAIVHVYCILPVQFLAQSLSIK
jgi:hypothetical protein